MYMYMRRICTHSMYVHVHEILYFLYSCTYCPTCCTCTSYMYMHVCRYVYIQMCIHVYWLCQPVKYKCVYKLQGNDISMSCHVQCMYMYMYIVIHVHFIYRTRTVQMCHCVPFVQSMYIHVHVHVLYRINCTNEFVRLT